MLPHLLKVRLCVHGKHTPYVSHEFSLDDLKSLPPILVPVDDKRKEARALPRLGTRAVASPGGG